MAKIQPSVLNLSFVIGEGNTEYVCLSQCASIVNRRFYRQGLNWAVAGFTVFGAGPLTGPVTIGKLPNTWAVSNSWHKAYAAWKQQQDDAVAEAGLQSVVAKFRDFKIHADVDHATATFAANGIPRDMQVPGVEFQQGEWQASEIVIPNEGGVPGNTQEFTLHMVGPDANPPGSFGMIENYADSRAVPQSPDPAIQTPEASFYSEMIDVGEIQDEVIANVSRNDDLPYSQDNYPGGALNAPTLELVHKTFLSATTFHQVRKLSGTSVPVGLLQFINDADGPIDVIVHLVPGPSRGYLTQPMQDM